MFKQMEEVGRGDVGLAKGHDISKQTNIISIV